jgi:GntP family gluconate:H+ symporter
MLIGTLIFAKWAGSRIWQIPTDDGGWTRDKSYIQQLDKIEKMEDEEELPGVVMSFAPIVAPIILILLATVTAAMKMKGSLYNFIQFLGTPIVAVAIGLLICIYGLTASLPRDKVIEEMEKGIKSAGIIILITGAGGSFGMLIRDSGVGAVIAKNMAQAAVPALLLPFLISTIVRFIQGSGTVAMITAASITAPIIANMSVQPIFAALAACVGSLFFSYFNDSYFWVVNRSIGITEGKEQLRLYSVASTIAWAIGFIVLVIVNGIFG